MKYILCRPLGGLNDVISQIELCCRYAERSGRAVLVETDSTASRGWGIDDSIDNYFISIQKRLIINKTNFPKNINEMKVFPEFLQNRINSYTVKYEESVSNFCDGAGGGKITFDFQKIYDAPLLIHNQCGRNPCSAFFFLRVKLKEEIIKEICKRIVSIGGPYLGIHVRNTDYKSEYRHIIKLVKERKSKRIFLATDNLSVLREFQGEIGDEHVFNFSRFLSEDGQPIHLGETSVAEKRERNIDAIADLFMLALSSNLMYGKLAGNAGSMNRSGFSALAESLWAAKPIIKHALGTNMIDFGLG